METVKEVEKVEHVLELAMADQAEKENRVKKEQPVKKAKKVKKDRVKEKLPEGKKVRRLGRQRFRLAGLGAFFTPASRLGLPLPAASRWRLPWRAWESVPWHCVTHAC